MANTYSQIFVHIVFAVEGRQNLIAKENRDRLHKYITGIVKERGQKLLAIFCMPDHAHILVAITPSISLSDLVRDIKSGSSKFINESGWVRGRFNWQDGFGAFSYSKSQIDDVVRYILNQEQHHMSKDARTEYITLLTKFEVEYDERYIFTYDD